MLFPVARYGMPMVLKDGPAEDMAVITLTTDFGLADEFAGVMKGVILSIHPQARIVDISHDVAPQDAAHAASLLAAAFSYFPEGTVHVAVVDPGVGTDRKILAVETRGFSFIAPDNGLLGFLVADDQPDMRIFSVENRELFLSPVSRTFHGRDVFAPVAAHLAAGAPLESVGPAIRREDVARLTVSDPRKISAKEVRGSVTAVDRFGNLITDFSEVFLSNALGPGFAENLVVHVGGLEIRGVSETFTDGAGDAPVCILGSRGMLEIAVNLGSAARLLDVGRGEVVLARLP